MSVVGSAGDWGALLWYSAGKFSVARLPSALHKVAFGLQMDHFTTLISA
ncbi:MAG: hypothetical protein GX061_07235 [Eubacteriaceae bacterium]|nr:hypothetical protein [Eubacteriaceae bacterium]